MSPPEGYRKAGKAARLLKCIYGLKQLAREQHELLAALLRKLDKSMPTRSYPAKETKRNLSMSITKITRAVRETPSKSYRRTSLSYYSTNG